MVDRRANPFMALADPSSDNEEPNAAYVPKENVPEKRKRKARKTKKQRTLIKRFQHRLMRLVNYPKQFIITMILSTWHSLLDAIGNRKRSADLEQTVRLLASRIEALEKHKPENAVPSQAPPAKPASPIPIMSSMPSLTAPLQDSDAALDKYRKMLAVGVPEPAVRQKMVKDGMDPDRLFPPRQTESLPCTEFKRSVKAEPKVAQTPAASQRSLTITVAALEEIRGNLRSASRCPRPPVSNDENIKPHTANQAPGFSVSVSTLQEIRGSLRKAAPRKTPDTSAPRNIVRSPGIRDVTNIRGGARANGTPYKTPFESKKSQHMSPSTARSDGEYLQLALLRKFQNVTSSPSE